MASPAALLLVLVAAAAHAGWNLLAKPARGGTGFVWLAAALGLGIGLVPAAAALALALGAGDRPLGATPAAAGVAIVASGALHAGYFVVLQRAYAGGDLSLVYPLARGGAPVLAGVGAVLALGERPSAVALAGTLVVVASVVVLAGGSGSALRAAGARGLAFVALASGSIAAYTVVDKHAVGALGLAPVAYHWATLAVVVLVLAPAAPARRAGVRLAWTASRRAALGVGGLSFAAYALVLYALERAPVAFVAPVRETSVLMAVGLGATVLGEGQRRRRLGASAGIVAGVALLTLG